MLLAALRIGIDQAHLGDDRHVREGDAAAGGIDRNVELRDRKRRSGGEWGGNETVFGKIKVECACIQLKISCGFPPGSLARSIICRATIERGVNGEGRQRDSVMKKIRCKLLKFNDGIWEALFALSIPTFRVNPRPPSVVTSTAKIRSLCPMSSRLLHEKETREGSGEATRLRSEKSRRHTR